MSGDLLGTLRYMSPEQALAKRVIVDERTDIYSLGVTLYELLTLEPAFPGTDRQEILRRIAFEDPKPPRRLNKSIPAELETIVLKAMEKSPADRYTTAQHLADDLRRYLEDKPILAKRPSPLQWARKWARRHKAAVRAAALCLSVSLIALGSAIGWAVRDQAARVQKIDHDRRTREETLDRTVERILDETAPLIEEGKWAEARAAVERADNLLGAAKRAERTGRLLRLQKELSMAESLEEIYGEPKKVLKASVKIGEGIEHQFQVEPDPPEEETLPYQRQDRRFAKAFQEFGIDLEKLAAAEAAACIGRTSIRPALIQALDEWAPMRRGARGEDDPFWKKLVEVARLADPDPWRNRFREALLRRDRPALEKLADAVSMHEAPPATALLLGLALKDLGALDKTMTVLREGHRQHPEDFWLNNTLGWLSRDLLQPPRYEDALRYFMAAVALRPRSWHTHWDLAVTLQDKGALEQAIAEYSKAEELGSISPLVWRERGDAYYQAHQYEKAIAHHSKAIELAPSQPMFWADRGFDYMELRRYGQALPDLSKAIELAPKQSSPNIFQGAGVWHSRGHAYMALGDPEKALADFSTAIAMDGNFMKHWRCRGAIYSSLSQWDKAVADFSKAIELSPEQMASYYYIALSRLAAGDLNEYQSTCALMLQRAQADKPEDANWVAWTCALHPDSVKDWARPIQLAEQALQADPKNHNYSKTLGAVLYRSGRFAEAVQRFSETSSALEKATVHGPLSSSAYTLFFLAMAHQRLSHAEEARQWLDKAIKQADLESQNNRILWNHGFTLRLLRQEAETVLKGSVEVQSTAKEEKRQPKAPEP
jgi:tetratricopeptide (TPR) repeat protein